LLSEILVNKMDGGDADKESKLVNGVVENKWWRDGTIYVSKNPRSKSLDFSVPTL
jgi:hypothetical protein